MMKGEAFAAFLVWKAGRMRPLRRPRRRRGNNINIDLQEMECGSKEWIVVVHDRDRWRKLANAVMNFIGP